MFIFPPLLLLAWRTPHIALFSVYMRPDERERFHARKRALPGKKHYSKPVEFELQLHVKD
jgi:hypothetical protein